MLAIRMRRVGSKKRPFFRVVVAERRPPRDGSFVEILGHYYPRTKPAKIGSIASAWSYWMARAPGRPTPCGRSCAAPATCTGGRRRAARRE